MGSVSNTPERFTSHHTLMSLLEAALSTRSQLGWSRWLQGEIQDVLPHDALIAAWGDFAAGELTYDVTTRAQALSLHGLPGDVVEPLMQALYAHWLAAGQEPVAIDTRSLRSVGSELFSASSCVLVHGVQDRRSRCDCIYVFVGPIALAAQASRDLCRMALPYIDTAFRQLADRGQKGAEDEMSETGFSCSSFAHCFDTQSVAVVRSHAVPRTAFPLDAHGDPVWGEGAPGERGSVLSAREFEVMGWVRMGKTNSEIAMILNLSTFTVKNHMRRIYRKLDVLNRAQAVGCLDRMSPAAAPRAVR
jgi:transcriptional regulator EpsA